jgi:pimeloyl-ACP methyl ester carboxylesterase
MTMTSTGYADIRPFRLDVSDAALADLHDRLDRTRWTDDSPPLGWNAGVPVGYLKELAGYWRSGFDWRAQEAELNSYPQFTTSIDGQHVHFMHIRSPEPDATPLLVAHGYPTSSVEFLRILRPLTDPRAHGADPADAFHVVAPSIPGFGLSTPVTEAGWEMGRTANAFSQLMRRLGYEQYGLHGGDVGAGILGQLAAGTAARVLGVHVTSDPGAVAATSEHMPLPEDLSDADRSRLGRLRSTWEQQKGYLVLQSTRPHTLAHGLGDSPVAQLPWIVDSFQQWTDPTADLPEDAVDRDQLLTNVSLYWFTHGGASAARFLYTVAHSDMDWVGEPSVPLGWAVFNADPVVRRLMDPAGQVAHWSEFDQGGHFPAMEVPDLLVTDIRRFFRPLRSSAAGAPRATALPAGQPVTRVT